jgi:hypothetical protein
MEDFMTLNEATPTIKNYLTQAALAFMFNRTRQTISAWQNSELDALSYKTVSDFMKLETQLKSMCEEFRENNK